ncbi:MarR family winged helix-turn-helix transcriptional regulator [Sphingobium phenoxybenzoativorans]|uniref:MarR family winged helix-turn-helix transcriptional regulator n=1 Tax=Sphingobium phenoxybenzoativorans TaxID=1592790 RepID=UPI000871F262|nr:MarR family transcriptional regulator [Sphingobium phenoxybenzoativorans]
MPKTENPPVPLDEQLCFAIYSAGIAIQRAYKPLLDALGLTYPQYLVLNVLWREADQTVGAIAHQLALESSTLTPLLKRLEVAGLIRRARNPENERQVIVSVTDKGTALRSRAGCLGDTLLIASGETPAALGRLNRQMAELRDAVYAHIGGWEAPELH